MKLTYAHGVKTMQTLRNQEMINKIELQDGYSVVVENDTDKKETAMGVESWQLVFTSKQDVIDHIALLNKALEFWEYDNLKDKDDE